MSEKLRRRSSAEGQNSRRTKTPVKSERNLTSGQRSQSAKRKTKKGNILKQAERDAESQKKQKPSSRDTARKEKAYSQKAKKKSVLVHDERNGRQKQVVSSNPTRKSEKGAAKKSKPTASSETTTPGDSGSVGTLFSGPLRRDSIKKRPKNSGNDKKNSKVAAVAKSNQNSAIKSSASTPKVTRKKAESPVDQPLVQLNPSQREDLKPSDEPVMLIVTTHVPLSKKKKVAEVKIDKKMDDDNELDLKDMNIDKEMDLDNEIIKEIKADKEPVKEANADKDTNNDEKDIGADALPESPIDEPKLKQSDKPAVVVKEELQELEPPDSHNNQD